MAMILPLLQLGFLSVLYDSAQADESQFWEGAGDNCQDGIDSCVQKKTMCVTAGKFCHADTYALNPSSPLTFASINNHWEVSHAYVCDKPLVCKSNVCLERTAGDGDTCCEGSGCPNFIDENGDFPGYIICEVIHDNQ